MGETSLILVSFWWEVTQILLHMESVTYSLSTHEGLLVFFPVKHLILAIGGRKLDPCVDLFLIDSIRPELAYPSSFFLALKEFILSHLQLVSHPFTHFVDLLHLLMGLLISGARSCVLQNSLQNA